MKEKFGQWWLDVAKYIFTGVILSSVFSDLGDRTIMYLWGILIGTSCLGFGLYLLNQNETDNKKKKGKKK